MSCADAGAGTSFPCDVAPIIKSKCQRCHDTPQALTMCLAQNSCVQAPFPLTTWADTRHALGPNARVIDFLATVIETDVMPYQTDAISPPWRSSRQPRRQPCSTGRSHVLPRARRPVRECQPVQLTSEQPHSS